MPNRSTIPVIAFTTAFTSCLLFAYAWFNTDIGRSDSRPSSLDSRPGIWLTARTNLPGYTVNVKNREGDKNDVRTDG